MYEPSHSEEVIPTKRILVAKPYLVAYVVIVGFTLGLLINRNPAPPAAVQAMASEYSGHVGYPMGEQEAKERPIWEQLFRPSPLTARLLLRAGLPLLAVADGSALAATERNLVVYWTGRSGEKPQTLFQTMLPFLRPLPRVVETPLPEEIPEPTEITPPPVNPPPAPTPPQAAPKPVLAGGLPLVGIYHTHDYESYLSEFPGLKIGNDLDMQKLNSFDHSKRTVVTLGSSLAKGLEKHGVISVHAPFSHQDVSYSFAYTSSRKTARQIVREHPSTKILLDIHRDAVIGMDSKVTIKGKVHAKIRCIIGDYEQPRWEKNRAFCESLITRVEQRYPGLTLPTRVQNDTYNQDLMPGAILLEIGNALNQYEESDRSMTLLAEVLADMIRDGDYPK